MKFKLTWGVVLFMSKCSALEDISLKTQILESNLGKRDLEAVKQELTYLIQDSSLEISNNGTKIKDLDHKFSIADLNAESSNSQNVIQESAQINNSGTRVRKTTMEIKEFEGTSINPESNQKNSLNSAPEINPSGTLIQDSALTAEVGGGVKISLNDSTSILIPPAKSTTLININHTNLTEDSTKEISDSQKQLLNSSVYQPQLDLAHSMEGRKVETARKIIFSENLINLNVDKISLDNHKLKIEEPLLNLDDHELNLYKLKFSTEVFTEVSTDNIVIQSEEIRLEDSLRRWKSLL